MSQSLRAHPASASAYAPARGHVLFGQLLRGASTEGAARIYDRLGTDQVVDLVPRLDQAEQAVLAAIAFAAERAAKAAMLPVSTLIPLVAAGAVEDALGVLRVMAPEAARAVLAGLGDGRRQRLEALLFPARLQPKTGAHGRVGTALRLRRLWRG